MTEKRREWCVNYRLGDYDSRGDFSSDIEWCAISQGPPVPCDKFEREPGADDDWEEA